MIIYKTKTIENIVLNEYFSSKNPKMNLIEEAKEPEAPIKTKNPTFPSKAFDVNPKSLYELTMKYP